jgi:hypothetical protein
MIATLKVEPEEDLLEVATQMVDAGLCVGLPGSSLRFGGVLRIEWRELATELFRAEAAVLEGAVEIEAGRVILLDVSDRPLLSDCEILFCPAGGRAGVASQNGLVWVPARCLEDAAAWALGLPRSRT